MGSTISIINETNCILNIALKQVTPIYYENKVLPGQVVKREVGKIWFTLEATLWTGQNDYTDVLKDINVSSVARRAAGVMLSRTGLYKEIINGAVGLVIKAGQPPQTVTIQNVLLPATFSPDDHQIVVDWVHKFVVREHGIYAGGDKVIKIVGGPPAVIDPLESGEGTQFLKSTEPFGIIQG